MKEALLKNPLIRYFVEAREELRKVTWPNRQTVLMYSGLVIAICALVALYFGVLDYLLNLGLNALVALTD